LGGGVGSAAAAFRRYSLQFVFGVVVGFAVVAAGNTIVGDDSDPEDYADAEATESTGDRGAWNGSETTTNDDGEVVLACPCFMYQSL
jgi:hypothetical protein